MTHLSRHESLALRDFHVVRRLPRFLPFATRSWLPQPLGLGRNPEVGGWPS